MCDVLSWNIAITMASFGFLQKAAKSVLVMGTAKLIEPMLFEVPGFDEYSENLIKSSMIGVRKISFGKESVAETREIPYNNAV